eukprot:2835725-Alexandrium_andersonii.AAC.2
MPIVGVQKKPNHWCARKTAEVRHTVPRRPPKIDEVGLPATNLAAESGGGGSGRRPARTPTLRQVRAVERRRRSLAPHVSGQTCVLEGVAGVYTSSDDYVWALDTCGSSDNGRRLGGAARKASRIRENPSRSPRKPLGSGGFPKAVAGSSVLSGTGRLGEWGEWAEGRAAGSTRTQWFASVSPSLRVEKEREREREPCGARDGIAVGDPRMSVRRDVLQNISDVAGVPEGGGWVADGAGQGHAT